MIVRNYRGQRSSSGQNGYTPRSTQGKISTIGHVLPIVVISLLAIFAIFSISTIIDHIFHNKEYFLTILQITFSSIKLVVICSTVLACIAIFTSSISGKNVSKPKPTTASASTESEILGTKSTTLPRRNSTLPRNGRISSVTSFKGEDEYTIVGGGGESRNQVRKSSSRPASRSVDNGETTKTSFFNKQSSSDVDSAPRPRGRRFGGYKNGKR